MNLPELNAKYIQQLNDNLKVLDQNLETITTKQRETTRDFLALQRAMIQFLIKKEIISGPDDLELFHKLHLQNIAKIDQELAEKRDKNSGSV